MTSDLVSVRPALDGKRTVRKPRIAIVGGPDVDARIGLIECLRDEFEFYVVGSDLELRSVFATRGIPYQFYPLESEFSVRSDWRAARRLSRVFRAWPMDLVHCFDTKPAIWGRIAARWTGTPAIVGTLPGLGGLYSGDDRKTRIRRDLFRWGHRLAHHLSSVTVFQNPDDLDLLEAEGVVDRAKSRLIRGSGVSRGRFSPTTRGSSLRSAHGFSGEGKLVLMVARLLRAKGVLDYARAARRVRSMHPNVEFVLIGSQGDPRWGGLVDRELEEVRQSVTWIGSQTNVDDWWAEADLMVHPSYYREGIPRVLIEAALAGCPIVTVDAPGNREVVPTEEMGWRVPPRDPIALADAVQSALGRPQDARIRAESARAYALEHFELETIAEAHRSLYRELLS